MKTHAKCAVVSLLLLALVGCGGPSNPATFPVTGTVTYKGKAVDGATIIFVPVSDGAHGATARTKADGTFEVTTYVANDGMRPGDYMVKVSKYDAPPAPPSESSPDFDPNQSLEDQEDEYDPAAEGSTKANKNNLPAKYATETTSGLRLTVAEGTGATFDIVLE